MGDYLESGTRRDVCALLYEAGELRAQTLKTRLERHYDRGIDPRRFYDRVEALTRSGHVEKRVEGLHDVYALTDEGERALLDHYEWLAGRIAAGAESDDGADDG